LQDKKKYIKNKRHETTANTLTFLLQLLAKHQNVQKKLREEIINAIKNDEDIENLKYLQNVIKESMRLFSPASIIPKITSKDVEIGGYKIPKNTRVLVSVYCIHHDEEVYKNPFDFIPERFENDKIPHYSCKIIYSKFNNSKFLNNIFE
jgi:cytochrome P450